ncbi:hypothetical protein KKF34_09275 [Myxococcota bacterium]|nr:hypothetical protein [Myxococcota bacterium]MBU1379342.1 hypothetical protein [Myxococcota bacterium]MBU1497054.1 hypothetical protein [Myxococcota bacterium]
MLELHLKMLEENTFYHPRVRLQAIPGITKTELLAKMPDFVPFPDKQYLSMMFIIDWDHRLPSKRIIGRLLAFYEDATEQVAQKEFQTRLNEIKAKDLYPEFNVNDFEDMIGDENYLVQLNLSGDVRKVEFISPWRRNITEQMKRQCIAIVSKSKEFQDLNAVYRYKCGPLRVLSWVPPCQSRQEIWTIDVRYLTYCETNSIWGKVFLVDPSKEEILNISDFNMRV